VRRYILLPLVGSAVRIPFAIADLTGPFPVHPIVITLPLVGFLNGHLEKRGLDGLGLAIVKPAGRSFWRWDLAWRAE
jgi:hypothetical protein